MALQQANDSDAEEYHSLPGSDAGDSAFDAADEVMEPPVHPVPSMQGAFEESIIESTEDSDAANKDMGDRDPNVRRRVLLESKRYDPNWRTRWKQRPQAKYHPLLKLLAQILFGMHLLQQNQAKSNEEVVRILQTHVDEVDNFLERTGEDFDTSISDIDERIRHLALPMNHLDVFKAMLEDKAFRSQLLDGNDKIEKIIDRTARSTSAAMADLHQCVSANEELGIYLNSVDDLWPQEDFSIADVCTAMRGNEQGWNIYLQGLIVKGERLHNALIQLGTIIGEMSRLAASASRRNKSSSGPSSAANPSGLRSRFNRDRSSASQDKNLNKPLPREPRNIAGAQRVVPKPHPIPMKERYETPRAQVPAPIPAASREQNAMMTPAVAAPQRRPQTAGSPAEYKRHSTADLAHFLRTSGPPEKAARPGPLTSNPPEPMRKSEKKARSKSHSAADVEKSIRRMNRESDQMNANTKDERAMLLLNGPNGPSSEDSNQSETNSTGKTHRRKDSSGWRLAKKGDYRSDIVSDDGIQRKLSKRNKPNPPAFPAQTPPLPADKVEAIQKAESATTPDHSPKIDSAYSSGTDRMAPAPVEMPTGSELPVASDDPALEASPKLEEATPERPSSRLSLFPKSPEPQPQQPEINIPQRHGSLGANTMLASSPPPRRKSRSLSMRLFHRRNKTESIAV